MVNIFINLTGGKMFEYLGSKMLGLRNWIDSSQCEDAAYECYYEVGNILQVVPSEALPVVTSVAPVPVSRPVLPAVPPAPKPQVTQVLQAQTSPSVAAGSAHSSVVQVGNMLQVVPSLVTPSPPTPATPLPAPTVPPPTLPAAVAAPLPLPLTHPVPDMSALTAITNVISPLLLPLPVARKNIKIDEVGLRRIAKEKRRREKELKRQQKLAKHMLRKALLLKDAYPTVSELESQEANLAEDVSEEAEEPLPNVIITTPSKARAPLPPPPDKGILISPGFRDKPVEVSEQKTRKSVSFADGVHPGEGDDNGIEEHQHSPPPPTMPSANDSAGKKGKKKRRVKVRIVRVEDEEEEDNLSPPPPPPGSPPAMFQFPPPPPGFMYVPPNAFTVLSAVEGLSAVQFTAPTSAPTAKAQ